MSSSNTACIPSRRKSSLRYVSGQLSILYRKWTVEHFLGFHVDGYAVINGVETVWEYNGCKFHGCQCIKNPTNKQLEKQRKWIERKAHLEANGCHVIEMTDCRWRQKLRYIRKNPPKTEYGRILCFDNQECFRFGQMVK